MIQRIQEHMILKEVLLCSLLFFIFLKISQNNNNVTNNVSTTKSFGNFYVLFSTWYILKQTNGKLGINVKLQRKLSLLSYCLLYYPASKKINKIFDINEYEQLTLKFWISTTVLLFLASIIFYNHESIIC